MNTSTRLVNVSKFWLRTPIHEEPFEGVSSNHTAPAVGEKMSTSLGDNRKWTQDEIINNTRNVMRGLETLKNEHSGLLTNLLDFNLGSRNSNGRSDSSAVERVKANLVKESLEKIELGLGEAQVSCSGYWDFHEKFE